MEILKFSKEDITRRFSSETAFRDMVSDFERSAEIEGMVICKIRVNGLDFSEKDEGRFARIRADEIENIEIEMEKTGRLVDDSLTGISDYISRLQKHSLEIAEKIRFEPGAEGHQQFSEVISGVQWLIEALQALRPNLLSARKDASLISEWQAAEQKTMKAVKELVEAYENQDFVLASDVLEYELTTALGGWSEILKRPYGTVADGI